MTTLSRARGDARAIRGLYAVTPPDLATDVLSAKVAAALAGGAAVVQYRGKSVQPSLRAEQASALRAQCTAAGALSSSTTTSSSRSRSMPTACIWARMTRRFLRPATRPGPQRIIGASCYDTLERAAACAAGADYIAFGSFFPSRVKPHAVRAEPSLLSRAKERFALPIVAIGGIDVGNAGALIAAGADAVAIISALFDATDVAAEARRFARLFDKKMESA